VARGREDEVEERGRNQKREKSIQQNPQTQHPFHSSLSFLSPVWIDHPINTALIDQLRWRQPSTSSFHYSRSSSLGQFYRSLKALKRYGRNRRMLGIARGSFGSNQDVIAWSYRLPSLIYRCSFSFLAPYDPRFWIGNPLTPLSNWYLISTATKVAKSMRALFSRGHLFTFYKVMILYLVPSSFFFLHLCSLLSTEVERCFTLLETHTGATLILHLSLVLRLSSPPSPLAPRTSPLLLPITLALFYDHARQLHHLPTLHATRDLLQQQVTARTAVS